MLLYHLLEELVVNDHAIVLLRALLLLLPVVDDDVLLLGVLLLLGLSTARQVEERVVQRCTQRVVTLAVGLAACLVMLAEVVMLPGGRSRLLLHVLLVVVAAEGLLRPVSRRLGWLLDDHDACIATTLVEAKVGAGSIP